MTPTGIAVATALGLALAASLWVLTRPEPLALGGDNEALLHPLLVDAHRQLAAGSLPLWTTGRWGGSPLIGDPSLGLLYPPYHLGYVLTSFPHWRALDVVACLHLALVMTGTAWLLSVLGARPSAALAGAALVALSPTMVVVARSWCQYWSAIAWWPWLLGAAARLAAGPSGRLALLACVALAAQVYAGYPQFALHSGLVGMAWLVAAPGPARGRRLALAAAIVAGAAGLAAPQILPGMAMARASIRMGPGADAMMAALDRFALTPAAWLDVVRPGPMPVFMPCKLAPAVLALALVGAVRRQPSSLGLAGAALAAAVLATGPNPLHRVLHALPPASFFAAPVKLFYLTTFLVSVLAGLGIERLLASSAFRMRLLGVAVVMLGLTSSTAFLAATGALRAPSSHYPTPFAALLRAPPPVADAPPAARWLALTGTQELKQAGLNFGALWDLAAFNGVGALAQWRQLAVMEHVAPDAVVALAQQVGGNPVLALGGSATAAALRAAGYRRVSASGPVERFDAPAPIPRHQLVPRASAATAADAIAAARTGRGLAADAVVIEASALPGGADGDPAGRLTVVAARPALVELEASLARPTWLVAREPYYANWHATVDGRRVPVYPAGGFFLAVLLEAGEHRVTLAYREPGLLLGTLIALAAALALPGTLRRLTGERARPAAGCA